MFTRVPYYLVLNEMCEMVITNLIPKFIYPFVLMNENTRQIHCLQVPQTSSKAIWKRSKADKPSVNSHLKTNFLMNFSTRIRFTL